MAPMAHSILSGTARNIVRDYLPLLRKLASGPYGVVCGPMKDHLSDIDFGVYVADTDPLSHDKASIWAKIGENSAYWLQKGFVIDGPGADRVEDFERDLLDCLNGVVRCEERPYRIRMSYNYIRVGSIVSSHIIEDSDHIISGWQEELAVYPQNLRDTILNEFSVSLRRLPDDHHYIRGIERKDIVLTTGVVQRVFHDWLHMIFALNSTWHPGDRHVLRSLQTLPRIPEACTRKVKVLLWPPQDDNALQIQREILREFSSFAFGIQNNL